MTSEKITKEGYRDCADEPIHIPESIQGYGYLFAINPDDGRIKVYSDNLHDLLNVTDLTDSLFYDFIDQDLTPVAFIESCFRTALQEDVRLPLQLKLRREYLRHEESGDFHAVIFGGSGLLVIELEPASEFKGMTVAKQCSKIYAMKVVPQFKNMKTVKEMAQAIAQTVKLLTGFERVVIYKFNEDESGQVIAEEKVEDIESYEDLFYPATDIPAQARRLYEKNWIRLTPDVDLPPIELRPSMRESSRPPLDLSQSVLRSMSPIHLKYVRNQGLKASMSISLVSQGKLWGLVSCHHREPYYLSQDIRLEVESLSQLFSWQLYGKEHEIALAKRLTADEAINRMLQSLGEAKDIVSIFKDNGDEILHLMKASGFIFSYNQQILTIGRVPSTEVCQAIISMIVDPSKHQPFMTQDLLPIMGPGVDLNGVRGMLMMPLLAENLYYTAWFRDEHTWVRRWAGDPHEKTYLAGKDLRLQPRQSFTVHEETVRGESAPWTAEDLRVAEAFNKIFLKHALKSQVYLQKDIGNLKEIDKTKDEFLATLAHELRNPLAPIASAAEILADTGSAAFHPEAVRIIERQIKQMVTLVDDLMDVSRITRGKISMNLQVLSLAKILQNAREISARLISEKNHELTIRLPEGPGPMVYGDFTRLSQVFANVLNNAAKYTDCAGRIEIQVSEEGKLAVISVKDNGIGIPPESLPKIFDMFSQVDPLSAKTRGGLGIGLTLVRKIIALHGGTIEASSPGLGRGSCFTIKVPLSLGKSAEQDETRSAAAKLGKGPPRGVVLIVDDNVDSARMLEVFMKLENYSVLVAHSGIEALRLYEAERPDAVLLDIGLPDIDGYEVCRRMRAITIGKTAKIVAQTGWGLQEHKDKTKEAGFDHHMIKPVRPSTLKSIMAPPQDLDGRF